MIPFPTFLAILVKLGLLFRILNVRDREHDTDAKMPHETSSHTTKQRIYPLFIAKLACERDLVVAPDVLDLQHEHARNKHRQRTGVRKKGGTDRPHALLLERLQELGFLRRSTLFFVLELLGQLL